MAEQISKPGVNISQVIEGTTPAATSPSLIPCIVGPAFEVVDLLAEDGSPNSESRVNDSTGSAVIYRQIPREIPVAEFPAPHADTTQMSVLGDEVIAGISVASNMKQLTSTAFLAEANDSRRAGIILRPTAADTYPDSTLILAVDNLVAADVTADKYIDVPALCTPAALVVLINAAFGSDIASVESAAGGANAGVRILSPRFGAGSSVTVRASSGSRSSLEFLSSCGLSHKTLRVEGSGFYALDNPLPNVTRSSYVAWSSGKVTQDGTTMADGRLQAVTASTVTIGDITYTATLAGAAGNDLTITIAQGGAGAALGASIVGDDITITLADGGSTNTEVAAKINADSTLQVTATVNANPNNNTAVVVQTSLAGGTGDATSRAIFVSSDGESSLDDGVDVVFNSAGIGLKAATPLSNGDLFTVNSTFGQTFSGLMVLEVEANRFKVGTVDTIRSTYDADGNPTNQRYIEASLGEMGDPTPLAPKFGYFIASGLSTVLEGDDALLKVAKIEGGDITADPDYADPESAKHELTYFVDRDLNTGTTVYNYANLVGLSISARLQDTLLGTDVTTSFTFPNFADNTTPTAVAAAMSTAFGEAITATATDRDLNPGGVGSTITISSLAQGDHLTLTLSGTGLALFGGAAALPDTPIPDTGVSEANTQLTGKILDIVLNGRSNERKISITAPSTRLDDLVRRVNLTVGYDMMSIFTAGGARKVRLVSHLVGQASEIKVLAGDANAILGLNNDSEASGDGRPNPDVHVRANGNVLLGGEIMRSSLTGRPTEESGNIHLGYRALRLDLTPSANEPGILRVSNTTDLEAVYGPISVRNPLTLGIYFALLNAGDGVEVSAIGVDDVSEAEPLGTTLAYKRAEEFLRSHEVYAIAPLTASEDVISSFDAHVKDMSLPANRAERVLISSPVNPVRRKPTVLLSQSSDGAGSTGNANQVDLDDTPESLLAAEGIDTDGVIPFELEDGRQLYLKLTIGDDLYVYSVAAVSGARVTLRTSLTNEQNADGFYSTEDLTRTFSNAEFSLALRGTVLTLPGSSLLDKTAYSQTIRDMAQQYLNRRQLRLYPDTIVSTAIGGIAQSYPSYYYAAAVAGACASVAPQEPFTRLPLVGFSDVTGPDLERAHLDTISAGNAVVEVDVPGERPAFRLQATTDVSSIESREWSITRAVDFFAKTLRGQLKRRIGRFNITQAYIDDISVLLDGACTSAVTNGIFRSAVVTKLEQDKTQPDTLLIDIQLEVLFPANYIQLTLVV